ncbi:MAG TPA: M28 family metallopeptidase [Gemmatimonadales bacterium]|nr:M28 family metallopeptidase [Gemmatimonadales bacterium]
MRRTWWGVLASGLAATGLAACDAGGRRVQLALDAITTNDLVSHIQVLASDSFEGRGPASPGEQKTIAYLRSEFEKLGLRPGNAGEWFQAVPLVAITADRNMTLSVTGPGGTRSYRYGNDFIAFTRRVVPRSELTNSELVFAGYGVVAPEYGWNDYEGLDVRGKTVIVLVNDPGFATGDTTLFRGRTMTYYGRWTYKYEEAARQGAAGVLIVHETEPAAYPWEVVTGSWGGEQFGLVAKDSNRSRAAIEGWLTVETAHAVFRQAGRDYDSLKTLAMQRGFRPVPLGLRASVTVRNRIRTSTSNNVLALLPGAARPDEYVIYMAHWDHLGRDTSLAGDEIYNGALDNASGTAGLLALAKAFASLDPPPGRSIVFLAVTAEEQGLIGSAHYAQNPVYPHDRTAAVINMDGLNHIGPMRDITVIGYGNSELDDYLAQAARTQNRVLKPDAEPEKGFYYRSDHFNFAKAGVPALYTDAGVDHVERGEAYAREQRDEYTAKRYHKPADEYDPSWDLRGAIDDLRLLFLVGYRIANESTFPNWRPGTEFRAIRDSMMAGRGGAP